MLLASISIDQDRDGYLQLRQHLDNAVQAVLYF